MRLRCLVAYGGHKESVTAYRVNRWFAIHRSISVSRSGLWDVTHVLSGLRVPTGFSTPKQARRAAHLLDALLPDWQFTDEHPNKSRFDGFGALCRLVAADQSVGVCGRYRADA